MAPLPSEGITPGLEEQKKEWLETNRPVCHRTVRSETTKDKGGALPPAVFAIQPTGNESEEKLPFPEEINIIKSVNSAPQPVVSVQFVDDGMFLRCSKLSQRDAN